MADRLTKRAVLLLLATPLVASCGGGDGSTVASGSTPKATLAIITTNIETARGQREFAQASEGARLDVGDRVRTDETGFAEITYQDGSWQRVENRATLTILALSARGSVNRVRTGVGVGRTWNNVKELDDPDDVYEVRTPVGTAAVRGTVFATDCVTTEECTFTVLEGTVRITPTQGDSVALAAGLSITVSDSGVSSGPAPSNVSDPWIVKNRALDDGRSGAVKDTRGTRRGIPLSACRAFSAGEAQYLASQRDDGRAVPVFEQSNAYDGTETPPADGWVSSECSWSAAGQSTNLDADFVDAGIVQLDLSIGNGFGSCGAGGETAPPDGGQPVTVGDAARWYPDRRTVIAYGEGICIVLAHSSVDAGTAGERAFADAAARIFTRLSTAAPGA